MFSPATLAKAPSPDALLYSYRNQAYPKQLWYFLASLIAFIAVLQFLSFLHAKYPRRRSDVVHSPERSSGAAHRGISLRRIPTALLNSYRVIAFRCTLNIGSYSLNLAEVFLTAIYIIALFVWAFVNTTDLSGNKLAPNYWTNRAGSLAVSQLPLIVALGSKNNIISFITGVGYNRLSYLHRMTARVVFVLLWVHSAGHLYKGVSAAGMQQTYIRGGFLCIVAFSALCVISLRPIRNNAYEIFFYTHLVMVIILLVGAYVHVKPLNYAHYVWPSFVIWGLDRFIRFARLVIYNHSYFGFYNRATGSGTMDASTELLSPHLIRVTLRRPAHFHWSPGQLAYLTMPGVSTLPFESHPFTIASFDSADHRENNRAEIFAKNQSNPSSTPTLINEKGDNETASYWNELVFLINVHGGFTKRLAKTAAEKGSIKVFVDGPYGEKPHLNRFDTVVLIAGGSGISYTLPVFLDTIERVRAGTSDCTKILFVWSIRDSSHIHWISDALTKAILLCPTTLEVEVRIFVTLGKENIDWDDDSVHSPSSNASVEEIDHQCSEKPKGMPLVLGLTSQVNLIFGRPDLAAMLHQEAERTRTNGRMSVNVCGSQSIASAVRSALRFPVSGPKSILKGGASVTLHVESFGHA